MIHRLRLIQFLEEGGRPRVGWVTDDGSAVFGVGSFESTYALALAATSAAEPLDAFASRLAAKAPIPYAALLNERRVLAPLSHPDPARCLVSGTGLTHYGSASARDQMHKKLAAESLSDSMQMFKWGVEGGRPAGNEPGAQPEWFYKGDGDCVVACGQALPSPSFALDGGEEPEIVGLYLIAPDGTPQRLGFAIGNEFSDHATERKNYLYLAHSKLRPCAIGPELRTGALPAHLEGASRIRRSGNIVWERPFVTGEANMCHSLANLESHHCKYAAHRRPGDVHLHFFGTATLSFVDGFTAQPGDVFEVALAELGATLTNPLAHVDGGFTFGGVRA
ncbi:MAG TPA: AraD1 family protein, partial [Steroidobacteraceae bacterium]|nr:AraD1 family protein [Steroidobacteraceae bacterium]